MPLPSQCARWELHRCYSELCFWLGRQIIPTHIRFGQHEQIDRYDALALPVDWFRDYFSIGGNCRAVQAVAVAVNLAANSLVSMCITQLRGWQRIADALT
jgi:hypothetical protein